MIYSLHKEPFQNVSSNVQQLIYHSDYMSSGGFFSAKEYVGFTLTFPPETH